MTTLRSCVSAVMKAVKGHASSSCCFLFCYFKHMWEELCVYLIWSQNWFQISSEDSDSPWWCPGAADFSIETLAVETVSQAPPPTDQLTCTHHHSPLTYFPVPTHPLWHQAASPQLVGSQLGGGGAPQVHTDSYWSWRRRAALWLADNDSNTQISDVINIIKCLKLSAWLW